MLGVIWAVRSRGLRKGFQDLWQPAMLARFFLVAVLSALGDMLGIASMKHLDAGTYTLIGKGFTIIVTVIFSRLLLGQRQSPGQYAIVGGLATATLLFCWSEAESRGGLSLSGEAASLWSIGLAERSSSVCMACVASVLQEAFLSREPRVPYLIQQCWIAFGGMATSLIALRVQKGELSLHVLFEGFDQWPTYVAITLYMINALAAGL